MKLAKDRQHQYNIISHELKHCLNHPITLILLFVLSVMNYGILYKSLSFKSTYISIIQKNNNQYYDRNVLTIKNYEKLDSFLNETVDSLDNFTKHLQVFYQNHYISEFYFKPIQSNDNIVINSFFLKRNEIQSFNHQLLFQFNYDNISFEFNCQNIKIVNEKALFTKPCIYYNYTFFKDILIQQDLYSEIILNNQSNDQIYFLNQDFLIYYKENQNHCLFTNNPFSHHFNATSPYYISDAFLDFYVNYLLFISCNKITYYFLFFCILCSLFALILYFKILLYKNYKKIAIYLQMGASHFECFFSFYFHAIFVLIMLFIIIIIKKKNINILLSLNILVLMLLLYFILIFLSIYKFKHKDLIRFLRDETIC